MDVSLIVQRRQDLQKRGVSWLRENTINHRAKKPYYEKQRNSLQDCATGLKKHPATFKPAPLTHSFQNLQATFPFELRESIYEHLFDSTKPVVIPKIDKGADDALTQTQSRNSGDFQTPTASQAIMDDGFVADYYTSSAVMGLEVSNEVQELVLRKAPVYLRGLRKALKLTEFLYVRLQLGRCVRDLTRHSRIYLRCEDISHDGDYLPSSTDSIFTCDTCWLGGPAIAARHRV